MPSVPATDSTMTGDTLPGDGDVAHVNGTRNGHDPRPALPTVRLHGVTLHALTEAGAIEHILGQLDGRRGGVVVTPNLDHIRRSHKDIRFGVLVAEADLVLADGMPLIWASRIQGTPLPERVAGSDLISSLSAAAAGRKRSIFLLGGSPGTAEGAARVLRDRHPDIAIVGTHCPPVGFEANDEAMATIIGELAKSRPDIVYVALGSPKQEMLVERIRWTLPEAWWLGVGNSFSFLCGQVPRAPRWMQRCGLEWAHRLIQEPRRLFKRYLVVGLPYAVSLMSVAAAKGAGRQLGIAGKRAAPSSGASPANEAPEALDAHRHNAASNGHSTPPSILHANGNGNGAHHVSTSTPARRPYRPAGVGGEGATTGQARSSLAKLRGLILLGGSIRPTPLTSSIGRSVLDLPLDEHASILDCWMEHAERVARMAELPHLPVRLLVDQLSPSPVTGRGRGILSVEQDRSELRGTGGVLGDLTADYADDDLILVANAAQVLLEPLPAIAKALKKCGGEVGVVAHDDGTPSGVMLLSGAALRFIPRTGFVDMKEQALPLIASFLDVTVMSRRRPTGLPVRSLTDYIMALRHYHSRKAGQKGSNDPLAEGWRPVFSIVEPGAVVDPNARVHDSVVLRGGRVEQGAVAVRSIVVADGTLRKDRTAVDQFVSPAMKQDGRRNGAMALHALPAGTASQGFDAKSGAGISAGAEASA